VNYWLFGDYLGLGAGAHSKITDATGKVSRHSNHKHPRHYLLAENKIDYQHTLSDEELPLEFMLNTARLNRPIPFELFIERTQLTLDCLLPLLQKAQQQNFVTVTTDGFTVEPHGRQFLNELLEIFV
jgi:oxygen-independent coproporphyrinogen-3 oxidase